TVMEMRATARQLALRDQAPALIVFDYLQMIDSGGRDRNQNRAEEVGHISRELKMLAGELACPVIALAQLHRSVELRNDKRPTLADLRDSGRIEEDSDIVLGLYRDDYYNGDESERPGEG